MSFNNHDSEDPNGKKYGHKAKVIKAIVNDIDDDSEDFELMQVFLMAKAMKYSQWKEWLAKNKYRFAPLVIAVVTAWGGGR